jgi:2-polyprenyl-6-methoxyphenol hydroxylase-like FAD-dependent oxidoreductase
MHMLVCAPVQAEDVPSALARYSRRRLPDVLGICALSERGTGGAPLSKALFVAQVRQIKLQLQLKLQLEV